MTETKHWDRASAEGLDRLYRRYSGWLLERLRTRIGPADAADAVQETYLRIAPYQRLGIQHPRALLMKVALNVVRDDHRRQMTRERPGVAVEPIEAACQAQQVLLKQVLLTMPELYRDTFVLNRFRGMTYHEIALAQGVSVQTVAWRMSRALQHCTSKLDI